MKAVLSLLVLLFARPLVAEVEKMDFTIEVKVNSKVDQIYYVMTELLKKEFVNVEDKATQCHLVLLASTIVETNEFYKRPVNETRLIALGFNESRLGVNDYPKGKITKSKLGACGVFQQIPKFSERPELECEYYNVANSVENAVWTLRSLVKKYSDDNLNKDICHYYSGNKCDDKEALEYAKKHKQVKEKADLLIKQVPKGFKMPLPSCEGTRYVKG